jgi:hypothetical protein
MPPPSMSQSPLERAEVAVVLLNDTVNFSVLCTIAPSASPPAKASPPAAAV